MMKRLMTSTLAAAALAVGGHAAAQNIPGVVDNPGQPDPTDRGGEFTIHGCLERGTGEAGSPPVFILKNATTATGEGRMASAQGAGVPVRGADTRATPPSDPPDIVFDEYRVVGQEDVDLAEHVNSQVRLRGRLSEQGVAGATARTQQGADDAAGAARSAATGATPVLIVDEVDELAAECEPQNQRQASPEGQQASPQGQQNQSPGESERDSEGSQSQQPQSQQQTQPQR